MAEEIFSITVPLKLLKNRSGARPGGKKIADLNWGINLHQLVFRGLDFSTHNKNNIFPSSNRSSKISLFRYNLLWKGRTDKISVKSSPPYKATPFWWSHCRIESFYDRRRTWFPFRMDPSPHVPVPSHPV